MAESSSSSSSISVDPDPDSDWSRHHHRRASSSDSGADDIVVAMETLLATLRAFEDVLRQRETSVASSAEYCDNFCQALMHYAGSRNSVEHGLPLLEVYCLSIDCFATARSHLTAESDSVALVLKRLALSCFELLLSVPENEIPYEAWLQFHNSVQIAHDNLLQFGSTDLQALLQITGEGGAWSNPILTALLTGQPTVPHEINAYIGLEGEGFMEMRVKHLEKIGEIAKAVVLAKACSDCCLISNQTTFRQTCVSLLCHLLPNEEAIAEISRLDCKDVLEITSNLEKEGEENTAFILCTTFLTQQLQQQNLYCSWELILLWSKLQRKIDPSPESLLERCLQLGAIANTVQHVLYLVRVIHSETKELGLASSVELCVKALQLPKQNDSESRISVLQTVSGLLKDDLEVMRACLLTEFLLSPSQEVFGRLQESHLHPDQKYDQENRLIPNSLHCELLLALKAYWPFDPEFWDWKTLKCHCSRILGMTPEAEEEEVVEKHEVVKHEAQDEGYVCVESPRQHYLNGKMERRADKGPSGMLGTQSRSQTKKHKLFCKICKKSVTGGQIIPHSRRHADDKHHPCPVCMTVFDSRKKIVPHMKQHLRTFAKLQKKRERDNLPKLLDEEDDVESGEIKVDPSLMLYYKSTHDPDVLHHIVQQAKNDDELHVTFDYIDTHFELQNRDEYPCPGTDCLKNFKHSKYLYVHLKSEHQGDENVKHFHEMRDKREKCIFCRHHFVSDYHRRKHRRMHSNNRPYLCTVIDCGAQFETSNEFIAHKHTHGYQLNFQCQLKGCYVTFSDLGQLYHHEAQHFREAAFTCTSPGCKKFYLSKKEFVEHLATHGITFSEEDFESQRKAKRKLFLRGDKVSSKGMEEEEEEEEEDDSSSSRGATSLDASSCKGPKGVITSVAVCFDGSKFTCGFEKCGMTFSRARDVQRHFKCAHPEHLKLENKDDRHDKERDSKSKGLKVETEQSNESSSQFPLKGAEKENNKSSRLNCNETNSTRLCQNDALKEILVGLSKLDLNSLGKSNEPLESSNGSHLSYCKAIMARSPVVVLQKRPAHMFANRVKVKKEATEDFNIESLASAKPYICKINGCDFRTAQSFSLLRHHVIIHNYTMEQARKFTSIEMFKPFLCQICSKGHKEKINLRMHYMQTHNLSEAAVEKINCVSVKHVMSTVTETSQHVLKDPQVRKKVAPNWQHRYQKRKAGVLRRETRKVFDTHSPSEEEDEGEEKAEEENGTSHVKKERKEEKRVTTLQVRTTRRHNTKSNLCYILAKFNKPFHCVVKDCNSAFSTQGGLVRHLQLVHHYNRSQLVLDKDSDTHQHTGEKKDVAKKKPVSNSDEPQPQFKCRFANCNASYHLKSSLVRHTRDIHCQPPEQVHCAYEGCTRVFNHASALKKHILYTHCEYYDSLVVRLQSTHKKSIDECQKDPLDASNSLPREGPHGRVSDVVSPVGELGTPDSELITPISDLVSPVSDLVAPVSDLVVPVSDLVAPVSELATPVSELGMPVTELVTPIPELVKSIPELGTPISELATPISELGTAVLLKVEAAPSVDTEDINPTSIKKGKPFRVDSFILRSYEEALQMCHKDCRGGTYPCMIQDCASVVKYLKSLQRHYFKVHHVNREDVHKNVDKLILNVKQLEELTQRKSAEPAVAAACTSNGVHKMEYQAEQENPDGTPVPMSLNNIKSEMLDKDPETLTFQGDKSSPVERNVLVGADDLLYGEPCTGVPNEEPVPAMQNGYNERSKYQTGPIPVTPTVTVDLSSPSSLCIASEEGFRASSCSKDGGKSVTIPLIPTVTVDLSPPYSLCIASEEGKSINESVAHPPWRQPLKRKNELSEHASNLKDTQPHLLPFDIASYKPMGFESSFLKFIQENDMEEDLTQIKRKDSLRRSCSVKENNQLGVPLTRSRRTRSPPLRRSAMADDFTSVQNLKSIMDKALSGCGDLAIKQLQYLRPVVVLERPMCTTSTTLPDLIPHDLTS